MIKTGIEFSVYKLASFLSGCRNQTYWVTIFCFKLMCLSVQTCVYLFALKYRYKDACAHVYKGVSRSSVAPSLCLLSCMCQSYSEILHNLFCTSQCPFWWLLEMTCTLKCSKLSYWGTSFLITSSENSSPDVLKILAKCFLYLLKPTVERLLFLLLLFAWYCWQTCKGIILLNIHIHQHL